MLITYHELDFEASKDRYKASVAQFEEHLLALTSLSQVSSVDYREFQVTFDDGHISHYTKALPVLSKHDTHCVFFITTDWIGRQERMDRQQIRELLDSGHQIGSHTCSHPFLPDCSDEQLAHELRDSREKLQNLLGSQVLSVSVPYGRWDRRVLRACRDAGYEKVYTSDPWLATGAREGVMTLGRLSIRNSFGSRDVLAFAGASGWTKLRMQAPFKLKQLIKTCIGDRIYHRAWHLLAHRDRSLIPSYDEHR